MKQLCGPDNHFGIIFCFKYGTIGVIFAALISTRHQSIKCNLLCFQMNPGESFTDPEKTVSSKIQLWKPPPTMLRSKYHIFVKGLNVKGQIKGA